MHLRHLEVFREVMLTDSVTKAARNLGRTQPAISACIAGLEDEIGYALFERKNGRLHAVPEAHFLLAEAEEILNRVNTLERSLKGSPTLIPSQLRIASMPILAEFFIPRLITRFVAQNSNTRFFLNSSDSAMVYERISAQQFDVGLAETSVASDLVNIDPIEANCVCALPSGDALAARPFITPADLSGKPAVSFMPGHFVTRGMKEAFSRAGADFNVQFELQNAAAHYALISNRIAYSVFSPLSAWIYLNTHRDPDAIIFRPFQPSIPYRFAILTPVHKSLSQVAQAFVSELRKELDSALGEFATTH